MAIVPSGVSVPAQSKELDNTTTTTAYGIVYRQVVTLADPETATNYMRVGGNGAYVDVRNVVSLPLPTGASTAALQTSGNASLTSIDTKLPSLDGGYVPVTIKNSSIEISNDAGNPVPVSGTFWQATQPVSGTFWQATQPVSFTRLSSGTDSVTANIGTTNGLALDITVDSLLKPSSTLSAVSTITNTVTVKADTLVNQTNAFKVDGSAVTQPVSAVSLPLPTGAATAAQQPDFGTAGTPSPDVLTVQGISGGEPLSVDVIQPVITKPAPSSYLHLNANGTTTAKSGAGVLRRIIINTRGGIVNTLTIYDNTAATGAVIGAVDTVNAGGAFDYELDFTTGLTVVLAGGTAADITIIYE
jgi:hypothetical protein